MAAGRAPTLLGAESARAEASNPSIPSTVIAMTYRLATLGRSQAITFLEQVLGYSDGSAVIAATERYGLTSMLETPGKLKLLAKIDLLGSPPTSLAANLQRTVMLQLDAPADGRRTLNKATTAEIEIEVTRLAAASTLCERLNIALPAESETSAPSSLSARTIVRGLLDGDLQYLLSSDFFQDSGHHQVKFQPDDVPLLLGRKSAIGANSRPRGCAQGGASSGLAGSVGRERHLWNVHTFGRLVSNTQPILSLRMHRLGCAMCGIFR